uniref:Autophagy-related protein n=1 Tax=Eutreptiella gymnastica TaxID=73025 RepID=A0A7S1I8Q0_9EUGL
MLLHPPGLPSASSSSSSSSSAGSGSDRPPPLTSDSLRAPNPIDVDEVSSEDEPPRRRSERIRRPVRRPQPVSAKRTITRCHSKSTSSSAQPAQPSNDGSDGEGPKEELADMAVDESEPAEDEDGNPNVYLTKPPKMKCRKFVEDYERERGTTLPADMRKNSMCPACIRRKGMDCTYFETEVRYGPVRAPSEDPQSGSGKKNKEEKTVGSRASSRKQQQRKGKGSPKQIGPPLMEVDANDSSAGDSTVAQRTRRASNEHGQMDKKPKEPGEPAAEEDMKDDENAQCTDDGNRSKNDFAHAEQRIQEEMQRLRDQWDTKCDELEKKLGQDIASAQAKNTSLSNSLAESSKNVWALGSRVSCLEEENKSLRCELGTCKETNAQLSSDLEKTAQQHNKQMHLKTQECTQLQQRVKDMEEMLRAEKRKTHEQTAKVTTLIAQQEQQMGDLGAQHRQSTLEMASAKAKVMDLTVECSKLQDDLSQATRKHAEEVKKRDDQILSMSNVTQTLEGTVRQLMALNTEKQQELDRASVDNKQYQQQIPELIEEVERLKKQITKLEDQLDDTKVRERQRSEKELQRIKNQHQKQLDDMEKQIEDSERSIQEKTQQLKDQLNIKSKTVWTYSRNISELKDENKSLKGEFERVKSELDQLTTKHLQAQHEHQQELERRVQDVVKQTERVSLLEHQLHDAHRVTKNLEATAASLRDSADGVAGQSQVLNAELAASRQQTSFLQSSCQNLQTKVQELEQRQTAELEQQSAQVRSLEADLKKAQSHCKELDTIVSTLESSKSTRESELKKLQLQLQDAQQKLDDLQNQNQALTDTHESLQQRAKTQCQESAMEMEAKELQLSAANSEVQQKEQLLQDANTEIQRLKEMLDTKSQKILNIQQEVDELTRNLDKAPGSDAPKVKNTTKNRQAEVAKILAENPNCIPIRCSRADYCSPSLPVLEKRKFVAPKEMSLTNFTEHVRAKLQVAKSTPLYVFKESQESLSTTGSLQQFYDQFKHADGFLHLQYSDKRLT